MCYSLHFMLFFQGPEWVASGGTGWHVTIWKVVYDIKRPGIERNPNLEIYCYEPKYQSLDDSVNMDDDADEPKYQR